MGERFIIVAGEQATGELVRSLSSRGPYCVIIDQQVGELVPRIRATLQPDDTPERGVRVLVEQGARYWVVTDMTDQRRAVGVLDAVAIVHAYDTSLH